MGDCRLYDRLIFFSHSFIHSFLLRACSVSMLGTWCTLIMPWSCNLEGTSVKHVGSDTHVTSCDTMCNWEANSAIIKNNKPYDRHYLHFQMRELKFREEKLIWGLMFCEWKSWDPTPSQIDRLHRQLELLF